MLPKLLDVQGNYFVAIEASCFIKLEPFQNIKVSLSVNSVFGVVAEDLSWGNRCFIFHFDGIISHLISPHTNVECTCTLTASTQFKADFACTNMSKIEMVFGLFLCLRFVLVIEKG